MTAGDDEIQRKIARAQELFEQGHRLHEAGDLDEAASLYKASIESWPTAEAHTFLGWVYSMQGDLDAAIAECERAIGVDEEFGNPWNDIGAYLIEKGELDKAIPYLERAKRAERYECRAFPHANLARIWIRKGMLRRAIEELETALEVDPRYEPARELLENIRFDLN